MKLEFGVLKKLRRFYLDYDPQTDTIDLWCRVCRSPVVCCPDRPQLRYLVVSAVAHASNPCEPAPAGGRTLAGASAT